MSGKTKFSAGFTTVVLIGLMMWASGCSASKPAGIPDRGRQPEVSRSDESFDPVMLQDEDIEFPATKSQPQTEEKIPLPEESGATPSATSERRNIEGFRVQLFATQEIEKATLEAKEAEYRFAGDGVAVYIEFDSPMYKVRIGDCATREAAEQLRELSRQRGYFTSWIVKTKVNSTPALPSRSNTGSGDH